LGFLLRELRFFLLLSFHPSSILIFHSSTLHWPPTVHGWSTPYPGRCTSGKDPVPIV
jgi:hypothetical protein